MRDYAFGNLITSLRTELGFSQFQLGKLIGVSDKAVSKWENGNAKPRMATCCRLADILGVSLDELLSAAGYVKRRSADPPAMEAEAEFQLEEQNQKTERIDTAKEKRIELHVRTGMSMADGVASAGAYIGRAARWGHEAIAMTDYGVTHAFPSAFREAERRHIKFLPGCEGFVLPSADSPIEDGYPVMLLATNREGMTNLNRLISKSHARYVNGIPCMLREWIEAHRAGLLIGSACDGGEVITAIRNDASPEELLQLASFYDYLEIQPIENEEDYPEAQADLQQVVRTVIHLGKEAGKPVAAVSNARYLDPEDDVCRAIVRYNTGILEGNTSPSYYLRTTEEMLAAFRFLGDETAREVVLHAPKQIADQVADGLTLMPQGEKFYPVLPEAQDNVTEAAMQKAHALYGTTLPAMVEERLQTELRIMEQQQSWTIFEISRRTTELSRKEGYPVGSRGAVGSSLVAYLCEIVSENPLPPHYRCPECRHAEFDVDGLRYRVGVDLPEKACPVCGCIMNGDGFDIPMETFFGLHGEKEPDIDLNIADEIAPKTAALYRSMFGREHVFVAGVISALWEQRASRYMQQYVNDHHRQISTDNETHIMNTISNIISGISSHVGGLVIFPTDRDVNEFTPVQPVDIFWLSDFSVTHYNFNEIYQKLLKVDLLPHYMTNMLQMLYEETGVCWSDVPLHDEQVMSLFCSPDALNVTSAEILCTTGTYGIPEFTSDHIRKILQELKPTTVDELIRISGYAHGTDVWEGNGGEYISSGIASCVSCPALRDDIFNDMRRAGLSRETAFQAMERVRRGKGLTPELQDVMRSHGIPEWYLKFCNKVKYMFPRAHATAYVAASLRIAWFKLHYPKDFYAVWITLHRDVVEKDDFTMDAAHLRKEVLALRSMLKRPDFREDDYETQLDRDRRLSALTIALEMRCRGIEYASLWSD